LAGLASLSKSYRLDWYLILGYNGEGRQAKYLTPRLAALVVKKLSEKVLTSHENYVIIKNIMAKFHGKA
jgi:hypothetical protein